MVDLIPPPQAGEYNCAVIDPPWLFKAWSQKGEEKSPQKHYSVMTMDEIAELPIGQWMSQNAVLACWATFPLLQQFFSPRIKWNDDGTVTVKPCVFESWGFTYSGILWVWRKYNPDSGKFRFGCGKGGTRKNLEPCFLLRRGKPLLFDLSQRDFIDEIGEPDFLDAKAREHSRKPDEQYERLEKMFDGPYLDIFSRNIPREGWDAWGNEVGKFTD